MSQAPVMHFGVPSEASGFSRYVLFDYSPRSPKAVLFTNHVRRDSHFPKHIGTRDTLNTYLRYRVPYSLRTGGHEAWRGYSQWRKQRLATD